jgi:hypothetical protein
MFDYWRGRIHQPIPLRLLLLSWLDTKFDFLTYPQKLNHETVARPAYGHCLLQSAMVAKKLGHTHISAIEFGVAGGNGLVALEDHALRVERETGVRVSVYGFDTGTGLPPPGDYRDLPYMWQEGYFAMDVPRLKTQLRSATLLLGPVENTLPAFFREREPSPIGFVSFDLDYYSSTRAALRVFESEPRFLLPRVACYFDDVVGDVQWAYNEFTGELLAIREFNEAHDAIKISRVRGLRFWRDRIPRLWHEQIYVAHMFAHPEYGRPTSSVTQLPLA